jgi:hypothetical protein
MPPLAKAKLIDFGFVRNRDAKEVERSTFAGTLGYAAPEQIRAFALSDERSDLFSFGAILYECLAGRLPFRDLGELFGEALPPAPSSANPAVPPACDALVLALLERHPLKRPGSAAEVAARLEEALHPGGPAVDAEGATLPSAHLIEYLRVETGGRVPRLAAAYLRFLVETGLTRRAWGELYLSGAAGGAEPASPLVDALKDALAAELAADEVQFTAVAACFGAAFSSGDLAAVAGQRREAVDALLQSLAAKGFVEERAGTWTFRARLVARYATAQLAPERHREIHAKIADLLGATAEPIDRKSRLSIRDDGSRGA